MSVEIMYITVGGQITNIPVIVRGSTIIHTSARKLWGMYRHSKMSKGVGT